MIDNTNAPGAHKARELQGIPGITSENELQAIKAGTNKKIGRIPGITPGMLDGVTMAKPDYLTNITDSGMLQQQFFMLDKIKAIK